MMVRVKDASDARTVLEEVTGRAVTQSLVIRGYWDHVRTVTVDSRPAVEERARVAFRSVLDHPQGSRFIADRLGLRKLVDNPDSLREYAESVLKTHADMIDRSAVVFIHSVVDDTLGVLCLLVARHTPQAFFDVLGTKRIPFADVMSRTVYSIGSDLVSNYSASFEFMSVMDKADSLTAGCRKLKKELPEEYFSYDSSALATLDSVRIGIVHKGQGIPGVMNVGDAIEKATNIMLHFVALVSTACEIPIDIAKAVAGGSSGVGPTSS